MHAYFRKFRLLVIDEKSMISIGFQMVHQIDLRLRTMMASPTESFGRMTFFGMQEIHEYCVVCHAGRWQSLVMSVSLLETLRMMFFFKYK